MKKALCFVFCCLALLTELRAQELKLFEEEKENGYIIYANNPDLFPVSVLLDLKLTNIVFSDSVKKVFVVPAKSEKYKIGEMTFSSKNAYRNYRYSTKTAMGDVTLSNYDSLYQYDLPYAKGKSFPLTQGYFGKKTHQTEMALDFTMPEGTEIVAARGGTLVQVVKSHKESCPRRECEKYNNFLIILHDDGTFACYSHIKHNGTRLKVGDVVKKGDVIASSGNVGWSSGPHLHFVCFIGGFDKWKSIETKFRIDKGDKAVILQEDNSYLKDY